MAITVYTGTPGSGKSLNVAKKIYNILNLRKLNGSYVIANFMINKDMVKHVDNFFYITNENLTPKILVDFAKKYHVRGVESQTVVYVDECSILWNSRTFQSKDRMAWLEFFAQHRKLGFDFVMITQSDMAIDKQIRFLIENKVTHRKINNFGFIGSILPVPVFVAIRSWYVNNLPFSKEFFTYRKKFGNFYDSYKMFSDEELNKDDSEKVYKRTITTTVAPKRSLVSRLSDKSSYILLYNNFKRWFLA